MKEITFKFRDTMSGWKWRKRTCTVESIDECIRIYGLDDYDVDFEIIEVKDVEKGK